LYDIIALVWKGAEAMQELVSRDEMLAVLAVDAAKIKSILSKQCNVLCMAKCPAFEEVADTQIYGFSCEVKLAEKCGILAEDEGRQMIQDLEQGLANIYATVGKDE
jgi:uncharacterized protein YlaN (UPF0358 family)